MASFSDYIKQNYSFCMCICTIQLSWFVLSVPTTFRWNIQYFTVQHQVNQKQIIPSWEPSLLLPKWSWWCFQYYIENNGKNQQCWKNQSKCSQQVLNMRNKINLKHLTKLDIGHFLTGSMKKENYMCFCLCYCIICGIS